MLYKPTPVLLQSFHILISEKLCMNYSACTHASPKYRLDTKPIVMTSLLKNLALQSKEWWRVLRMSSARQQIAAIFF